MAVNESFIPSKEYDEWFINLEKGLREGVTDVSLVYRFCVKDKNNDMSYRNVIIKDGICKVLPIDKVVVDVEFYIAEEDLLEFIEKNLSFYDLFLLSKLSFTGPKKDIYSFPEYFKHELFSRKVRYLTVDNIMNNIGRMIDEIPDQLKNKNICFKITGKRTTIYYIKIDDEKISSVPKGEVGKIHLELTMSEDTFLMMSCNELDYANAWYEGLITIKGDRYLGIEFDYIFNYRIKRGEDKSG